MREYAIIVKTQEMRNHTELIARIANMAKKFQSFPTNLWQLSPFILQFTCTNMIILHSSSIESGNGLICMMHFAITCLIFLLPQPYFGLSMFLRYNLLR